MAAMLVRPRLMALAAGTLCALALAPAAGAAWKPDPARYGVVAERNLPVKMSDGTTLKADVYRPAAATGDPAAGRFPVIVTLTPYRKIATPPLNALITRGYMHAVVDIRGTGTSGGQFGFFDTREQRDGPEVVRWAAGLPGSNGRVGMHGASYLGITQLLTAARVGRGSPLKAIMPIVAAHDVYRDFAAPGGMLAAAFELVWLGAARPLLDTLIPPEDLAEDPVHALSAFIERTGNITGTQLPIILEGLLAGRVRYDGAWYRSRSPGQTLAKIVRNRVPALLVGGWSDVFQRGEPLNFAGLQNATAGRRATRPMGRRQRVSSRYQLVQGPWFHGEAGAAIEPSMLALRWFDTYLKRRATGLERERTPLHLFELGSGRWVDVPRWPIRRVRVHPYYLAAGPTGSATSRNDGLLTRARPAARAGEDPLPYSVVPDLCSRLTVQYAGGAGAGTEPCIEDDRLQQGTALTYTTAPFKRRMSIAGPIAATLYARSDRPDSSTIVTLQDVAPNGRSAPLTGGQLLGSFRATKPRRAWRLGGRLVAPYHPFTKASRRPMATGEVERLDMEVLPVLASIAPGHRLRLTITTNLTPILMPPPAEFADLIGGTTSYQRSARHPSRVNLPLIPSARLRTSDQSWGACASSC